MMISMSPADQVKSRITITVDPSVLARVRDVVAAGAASSVSSFFEHAALSDLDADRAYGQLLDNLLEATGGPLTAEEIDATDRELGYLP